jgi:hypothetical protein
MLDKKYLILIGIIIIILAIISIVIVITTGKTTSKMTTSRVRNVLTNQTQAGNKKIVLSDQNGNLSSIPSFDGLVPKGTIVMWNGKNVPEGWALCDGKNNTPDLRGRMIKMYSDDISSPTEFGGKFFVQPTSGDSDSPTSGHSRTNLQSFIRKLSIGARGGSDVTQQDVREIAPHNHPLIMGRSNNDTCGDLNTFDCGKTPNQGMTASIGNTGEGWIMNNTPAYYVLAFIMKL